MRVVITPKTQPGKTGDNPSITLAVTGDGSAGIPCITSWSLRPSEISREWNVPSYPRLTITCMDWCSGGCTFWSSIFDKYEFLNGSIVMFYSNDGAVYKLAIEDWRRDIGQSTTITASSIGKWDKDDQFPPKRHLRVAFDAKKEDTTILLLGDLRKGYYRKRQDDKKSLAGEILCYNKELIRVKAVKAFTRGATELDVQRGYKGTEATGLVQGKSIEVAIEYQNKNVVDIVSEVLAESGFGTDSSFAAEKTGVLSSYNMTGILYKPDKAAKVLQELCRTCQFNIILNNDGTCGIRHITNLLQLTVKKYNDSNIIKESLAWQSRLLKSLPGVVVHYDLEKATDYSTNEDKFKKNVTIIDSKLSIGLDDYDGRREIHSRWYGVSLANLVANRMIAIERQGGIGIKFETLEPPIVGDNIEVSSALMPDTHEYQVWRIERKSNGISEVQAMRTAFKATSAGRIRIGISTIGGSDRFV